MVGLVEESMPRHLGSGTPKISVTAMERSCNLKILGLLLVFRQDIRFSFALAFSHIPLVRKTKIIEYCVSRRNEFKDRVVVNILHC